MSAIPQGWKLVPVEPTEAMLRSVDDEAEDKFVARGRAYSAWKSMLSAAPAPTAEPSEVVITKNVAGVIGGQRDA